MHDFERFARERAVRGCQGFLGRPQHERERRAEFVADVAEEHGLRSIELRQPFGARPLGFVGAGVHECRANLVGDEPQERAVSVVPREARIEADHQPSGRRPGTGGREREVLHQLWPRGRELLLCSGRRALQLVVQVGERERHVVRLCGERVGGDRAGVVFRARGGVALGEVLQQRHAAFADHPLGRFGDDAIDAFDLAGFAAHGIVGHVEIGFFQEPVALELEQQVLSPERLTRADDAGQQLVQDAHPDLAPGLPPGKAQRLRMLGTEDGTVRIVIKDGEFRTPEEDDLGPGREQHTHGAAQALRPQVGRPERGLRPVEAAHARTHFSPALEEREVRRTIGRPLRHAQIMSQGRCDRSPSRTTGLR